MYCQYVIGLLVSLKGSTLYLYTLNLVQKVVNSSKSGYILIQQKAYQILSLVNSLARLIQARVLSIKGSRYWSFLVRRFSFLQLIQKQREPSDFFINSTGVVKGTWLGSMKPLSKLLTRYLLITLSSLADIQYSRQNLRSVVEVSFLSLIQ